MLTRSPFDHQQRVFRLRGEVFSKSSGFALPTAHFILPTCSRDTDRLPASPAGPMHTKSRALSQPGNPQDPCRTLIHACILRPTGGRFRASGARPFALLAATEDYIGQCEKHTGAPVYDWPENLREPGRPADKGGLFGMSLRHRTAWFRCAGSKSIGRIRRGGHAARGRGRTGLRSKE